MRGEVAMMMMMGGRDILLEWVSSDGDDDDDDDDDADGESDGDGDSDSGDIRDGRVARVEE